MRRGAFIGPAVFNPGHAQSSVVFQMFLHFTNIRIRDKMACLVGKYGTGFSRTVKDQILFNFATFHERITPFPENSLKRGEEQAIIVFRETYSLSRSLLILK